MQRQLTSSTNPNSRAPSSQRAGRHFAAASSPLELLPPSPFSRREARAVSGRSRRVGKSASSRPAHVALFQDGVARLKKIGTGFGSRRALAETKTDIGFQPAGAKPAGPQPAGEVPKAADQQQEAQPPKSLKPSALALTTAPPKKIKPTEIEGFIFGGVAPMIAVLFTNPFDVVKTRMQLQGELMRKGEGKVFDNVFDCLIKTAKYDGIAGLQKGLKSMLVRELVINSLRLGTFEPILHRIHDHDFGPAPIWKKLIAGGIAGLLGSFAANPIELVKTRIQSRASSAIACGNQFDYAGPIDAAMSIIKENGITGMWKGATAGMLRATLGNAVMMSTYSTLREYLLHVKHVPQSHGLNISTSLIAGFVSSLAMNPVDVIRTRMYNQKYVNGKPQTYKNIADAIVKITATEGPTAFLKGFSSNYLFRGPQIVLTFNIIEAFKHYTNEMKRAASQEGESATLFSALDRDADGKIVEQDLFEFVKRAYARDGASDAEIQAQVDDVLRVADALAAREIDQAHFAKARGPLFGLARRAAEAEAFAALDADRDGGVSAADLAAAVRGLAPAAGQAAGAEEYAALVEAAAEKAVHHADRDRDGKVSFGDFSRLFNDYELHGKAGRDLLLSAWLKDAGVRVQ
eukprot:tig00000949_g5716.t1